MSFIDFIRSCNSILSVISFTIYNIFSKMARVILNSHVSLNLPLQSNMFHFFSTKDRNKTREKEYKAIYQKSDWDTSWSILHMLFSDLKVTGKINELESKVYDTKLGLLKWQEKTNIMHYNRNQTIFLFSSLKLSN